MSTHEHSRRVHELVDAIKDGYTPDRADVDFLRSFLPELPKQKTLEGITEHVRNAWAGARGNEWGGNSYNPDIPIEDWLRELYAQLKGVEEEAAPALPAGMRIAEHKHYGRVVVSPGVIPDGRYQIFVLDSWTKTGAECEFVHPNALTFLDSDPAKAAHPEFLETEADYQKAPRGTVAAKDGWNAWLKETDGVWSCGGGSDGEYSLAQSGKRRVLRWGWSK